jgi:hypothetical protein
MVFSSDVQAHFLERFETIVDHVHCIVSESQDYSYPEARLLLDTIPKAAIEQGAFTNSPIQIICR